MVGARVLFDCAAQGKEARALVRKSSDRTWVRSLFLFLAPDQPRLFESIQWVEGDILDVDSLEAAMMGCDQVCHAAAVVSFHSSDRDIMMKVNAEGTANVCNVALDLGIKKLCFISSTAALGRSSTDEWVDDSATWKDSPLNTRYAISKYSGEREVWRIAEEGLNVVILNPSIIIGAGDFTRSSTAMFETMHKGLNYYPTGSNAAVAVKDISGLCLQLLNSEYSGRFLAAGENITYKDLLSQIALSVGQEVPSRPATPWKLRLMKMYHRVREWITGKKALITRESIRNAQLCVNYKSERLSQELSFKFTPLHEAIAEGGAFFSHLKSTGYLGNKG